MNELFSELLKKEEWVSYLTPREPIVYIAAGIFGILLFVGFIISIFAIGFAIKRQKKTAAESRTHIYKNDQNEAIKTVISSLRSLNISESEIKEILISEYHFDDLTADLLLGV